MGPPSIPFPSYFRAQCVEIFGKGYIRITEVPYQGLLLIFALDIKKFVNSKKNFLLFNSIHARAQCAISFCMIDSHSDGLFISELITMSLFSAEHRK